MSGSILSTWLASCLLVGLRIAPIFAFAPPFSFVRVPALFRVLFGLGLGAALVSSRIVAVPPDVAALPVMVVMALRELGLGLTIVLAFQVAFGALYFVGRTVDIQAGFGLALLIDPTSQSQAPLVGTLFVYAAAGLFFAMNGHIEVLRFLAATFDAIPLGAYSMPHSIARLAGFMTVMFSGALGIAAGAILALFLVDLSIALMSRTLPQMNVLILGFQAKTIVLLLVLPLSFGIGGILMLRLMAALLKALPGLV
jgi:flagellar biosynthesis protein FliR